MSRSAAGLFLSLDQSRKHQVVVGAEGDGILVSRARKSDHIFSQMSKRDNLIDQPFLGTIYGSRLVIVFFGQGIHLVNGRLEWSVGILFFHQSSCKRGNGCGSFPLPWPG